MSDSFDKQISKIVSSLGNEVTATKNIENSLANTINISLEAYPNTFTPSDTTSVTISCNINKICDKITLEIDTEEAGLYTNTNSFVKTCDVVDAGDPNHIINITAEIADKTFTYSKILTPLT